MALSFSILCPEDEIAKGEAIMMTAPGTEGDFGILKSHAPFATLLRAGCLIVEKEGSDKDYFYLRRGFLRADADEVVVLADEVKLASSLNEAEIKQALSDCKDDIAHLSDTEKLAEAKEKMTELEAQLLVIKTSTN